MPLISFYAPLKTSVNLWFSDVFRGYRKRPVAWNGLRNVFEIAPIIQSMTDFCFMRMIFKKLVVVNLPAGNRVVFLQMILHESSGGVIRT